MTATLLVSINSSWNFVNFRSSLVRSWLEAGHRVVAAAPRDDFTADVEKMGVEFHPLPLIAQSRSPAGELRLLARYAALMRQIRPDAYLGFTIKPNVYGSIAARWAGVPTINNIAGLGIGFAERGLIGPIVRTMYRASLSASSTVFFQNRDDMAMFADAGIVARNAAMLLPGSGVDLARFAIPYPQRSDTVTFAMLSRLLRSKGILEFVEAAAVVKAEHPLARFLIAGIPDFAHADAIDAQTVATWEAGNVVKYLGPINDVRTVLRDTDCVVLPTAYPEGTPRSLLEAAAAGRALIGSDAPGVRDAVRPGVNGFRVKARDRDSIIAAMRAFIAMSSEQRAALYQGSRNLAKTEFDEALVIDAYRAAIDRAVTHPGFAGRRAVRLRS